MDEIITKIDALAKQMNERFETVDKRLDKMDGRLDKMDERFDAVETHLGNLEQGQAAVREDIKNSDDIFIGQCVDPKHLVRARLRVTAGKSQH